jgi:hypothetical protein
MKHLTFVLFAVFFSATAQAQISFLHGVTLSNGGEIVSYANGQLISTDSFATTNASASHKVQFYSLGTNGHLTAGLSVDLASVFGGATNIGSVSSVLADARGFGAASIFPTATGSNNLGRVAFFSLTDGSLLNTLDVGYHPDSISITPDGTKLLVANEGEFVSTAVDSTFARPGSISVVNLAGVTGLSGISALAASNVATYDFSAANLGSGVTLDGIRNHRLDTAAVKTPNAADLEPEYIAATDAKAYVTLQENNATAVFDFATGKFEAIRSFGAITNTVDASDQDGLAAVNDTVRGLPMPDTTVKFIRSTNVFLVTANEGDARPDDGDIMRVSQEGSSGRPAIDGSTKTALDAQYGGNFKASNALGRLNILRDQGDTDADGDIDVPTMMGTRSFSIWNAETGALAFDSGSMIEEYVLTNDPTSFNINSGSLAEFDKRSDDKGPEPEALAFGSINDRDFVFLGAERQNGIFQFDVTDFANVFISGYFNPVTATNDTGGSFISPESMIFLSSSDNPTGKNLLIVGFEGTGGNGSIATFEVVPEPSTYALLALAGAGLAAYRLRRRTRR